MINISGTNLKSQHKPAPGQPRIRVKNTYTKGVEQTNPIVLVTSLNVMP